MKFRSRKERFLIGGYILSLAVGGALTILSTSISVYNLGKVMGVWMLTALVFQVVLATRADIIENGIGYDRITNWHSFNGKLIGALIILHPLIMFASPAFNADLDLFMAYIQANPAALLGVIAVLMILGQVAGALYWKSLDYQVWRKLHMLGYVIVALGFAHSFLLGTETSLTPDNPLGYWWWMLFGVATASAGYSLVYRRFFKSKRFEVARVEKETPDVTTIELAPLEEDIDNEPGQFAYVKFDSNQVPREEHHFTISSGAEKEGITFTVKDVGDFTSMLDRLEEGDKADLEGPYGSFTPEGKGPYTFIAGGIGITPLMSMIRTIQDSGDAVQARLIYGNRTYDDIVFREELEETGDWLDVVHALSDEEREGFRHGFVDRKLLEELVIGDSEIFVCGPPPMMESVLSDLEDLGFDPEKIRFERFSLRD